jgi:hypothetical protein
MLVLLAITSREKRKMAVSLYAAQSRREIRVHEIREERQGKSNIVLGHFSSTSLSVSRSKLKNAT